MKLCSMFPSPAANQTVDTPNTENVATISPQVAPAMNQQPLYYIETTNTFLHQVPAPPLTTSTHTHVTEYPYQSLTTDTYTRNSIVTPLMAAQNPIVPPRAISPPEPTFQELDLENVGEVDNDHDRIIEPIKVRKIEDGKIQLWTDSIFSQLTDAFCIPMDISNPQKPSIPIEFRSRFERVLCNEYKKCTPTVGGVLKARQEDYWIMAIMIAGSRQQALDHIETGLEDVRAHARLRRLRILSFAKLGSGKFKTKWDQFEFLFHFFYQDTAIINVFNC